MNDFSSVRFFRLSPGGIECDEKGLRVGDVALLARDATGVWAARSERDLRDDGDPQAGTLLEAKANIGFMFDANDVLNVWVNDKNDPEIQMEAQAKAALAAGRNVAWHAQTV